MVENTTQVPVPGCSITANVEVVEPMGSEIYLYLDVSGTSITARIKAQQEPEVNAGHVLDVDMSKAHYFDWDTEEAILK